MVNTVRIHIPGTDTGDGRVLIQELQDALPVEDTAPWNAGHPFLKKHAEKVNRLVEIRGLTQTGDYLGISVGVMARLHWKHVGILYTSYRRRSRRLILAPDQSMAANRADHATPYHPAVFIFLKIASCRPSSRVTW